VNPRGETIAQASEDHDELLVADLDLGVIEQVRNVWKFYRDRRPEAYDEIVSE
jgi:N-carbamoylputrescine amidase